MSAITEQEQRRDDKPEDELALRDLELPDDQAGNVKAGARGGCDDWGCGSNHDEAMVVTA